MIGADKCLNQPDAGNIFLQDGVEPVQFFLDGHEQGSHARHKDHDDHDSSQQHWQDHQRQFAICHEH